MARDWQHSVLASWIVTNDRNQRTFRCSAPFSLRLLRLLLAALVAFSSALRISLRLGNGASGSHLQVASLSLTYY